MQGFRLSSHNHNSLQILMLDWFVLLEACCGWKAVCLNCAHAGKAVVKCSATQMTVSLEKDSMDGIDKNWLKMNDPSCSMSSNDTHIMATMSFNTCGTILEVCVMWVDMAISMLATRMGSSKVIDLCVGVTCYVELSMQCPCMTLRQNIKQSTLQHESLG